MKEKRDGLWLTHGLGDVAMGLPVIFELAKNKNKIIDVYVMSLLVADFVMEMIKSANVRCISIDQSKWVYEILKNKYDFFYFVHGEDKLKHNALYVLSIAKHKVVPKTNIIINSGMLVIEKKSNEHKVNYYRRYLGLNPIKDYENSFFRKERNFSETGSMSILIAPGSYEKENKKRWPENKWVELINKINLYYANKVEIIIFGAKSEVAIVDEIFCKVVDKKNVSISLVAKIQDTIKILRSVDLVLSVCNAMSHISSVMGVDVIALYGPTDPFYTGVFSSKSNKIVANMDCSPCYGTKKFDLCDFNKCMKSIEIDAVFNAVLYYLSKR